MANASRNNKAKHAVFFWKGKQRKRLEDPRFGRVFFFHVALTIASDYAKEHRVVTEVCFKKEVKKVFEPPHFVAEAA